MKPARAPFRDAVVGSYRGRDAELAVLHEAFAGAERGEGKAIGISAPPGLGKSRLCFEFARIARDRLVPVQEARHRPRSFRPVAAAAGILPQLLPDHVHRRCGNGARQDHGGIDFVVPHLLGDVALLAISSAFATRTGRRR